jgi:YidC/Oxa1 family membrane protein insertase
MIKIKNVLLKHSTHLGVLNYDKNKNVFYDILSQLTSMPGYIPDVPEVPIPESTGELIQQFNLLGEPTLASQGLGGMSPSGIVQTLLEHMHVALDLPWWGAIVVSK